MEEHLATFEQAAGRLNLSPWTLRLWARQGRLATVKLGRRRLIRSSEIDKLIAVGLDQQETVPENRRRSGD